MFLVVTDGFIHEQFPNRVAVLRDRKEGEFLLVVCHRPLHEHRRHLVPNRSENDKLQASGILDVIPPYHSRFDARAAEATRAIAFDGKCPHPVGYWSREYFVQPKPPAERNPSDGQDTCRSGGVQPRPSEDLAVMQSLNRQAAVARNEDFERDFPFANQIDVIGLPRRSFRRTYAMLPMR